MSKALGGSHLCFSHQGNHSHYASHNCELCVALARAEKAEAQLAKVRDDFRVFMGDLRGELAEGWSTATVEAIMEELRGAES